VKHSTEIYIEQFKRGDYGKIPIGRNSNTGEYYFLTPKQVEAVELLHQHGMSSVGYGGAARGGKTLVEAFWVTMSALAYADTGWFLARKELKRLRLTAVKTLLRLFRFYGLVKGEDYRYNQQDQVITFLNLSDIFFLDMATGSDPEFTRLGGYEFTGGAIDESNEVDRDGIDVLSGRCGWRNNDTYDLPGAMLETFNPDKGHVYERYWQPYRDGEEIPERRFIIALPTDNPHPSVQPWVDKLLSTENDKLIQRYIYGNFEYDDDPSKLFEQEGVDNMFSNAFVHGSGKKYITADIARFGKDSSSIWLWHGWKATLVKTLRNVDLLEKDPTTGKPKGLKKVYETIEKVRLKHNIPISRILCDQDGLGGGVVDMGSYVPFMNQEKAKQGENYNSIKDQVYFRMSEMVNEDKIRVVLTDSKLKDRFKRELSLIKDVTDGIDAPKKITPKKDLKKSLGGSSDLADGFVLRLWFEIASVAEIVYVRGI
jgi:hypothetical protein